MTNPPTPPDAVTLDVLQANVALLAEKERLEQERSRLIELNRVRTEFLARVSHDLRTPLNSIIGFSDLLLAGDGGRLPRKSLDYLNAIHRNGHALVGLINDLLDLSSMELGRITIRRQPFDLGEFLADVRAATDPIISRSSVQITWPDVRRLSGQSVIADRRRLLQVMTNLLDNARKFTTAGGRVSVVIEPRPHELHLVVSDNGPGVPEQLRQAIFQPLSSTTTPRHESTGLGLAIVKAIVDQHQGTITVERGPDGRGCSVLIHIPTQEDLP